MSVMWKVDLVGGDHAGPPEQRRIEGPKLSLDHRERLQRSPCIVGNIDHMDQEVGPLDVAEEANAEARSLRCPLDQSGDVSDHEATQGLDLTVPRWRGEGREGIFRDLGLCGRDAAQEG